MAAARGSGSGQAYGYGFGGGQRATAWCDDQKLRLACPHLHAAEIALSGRLGTWSFVQLLGGAVLPRGRGRRRHTYLGPAMDKGAEASAPACLIRRVTAPRW